MHNDVLAAVFSPSTQESVWAFHRRERDELPAPAGVARPGAALIGFASR
jgi:hypothetical protein